METTTETAPQPCMPAEPQKEHQWLQQLVGEWTFESECDSGPGKPREKFKGTESVKSMGGLWTVAQGQGEMPGGGVGTMMMTLGFDPEKKRYVGTFVASMMTYLWIYDGELDASGKVLTLNAEGPSFSGGGGLAKYRDVIEIKSADHRTLTSSTPDEKGNWHTFMSADYRRAK